MSETDENKTAIRKEGRLLNILNIKNKELNNVVDLPKAPVEKNEYTGSISIGEIDALNDARKGTRVDKASIDEIRSSLGMTSSKVASKISTLSGLNKLNPELKKARAILVPSIMSPNDITSDTITIATSSNALNESTNAKLSGVLNDYFNSDLHLGRSITKWIGDALFKDGATPILTIPKSTVRLLLPESGGTEELTVSSESVEVSPNIDLVVSVEDHFDTMFDNVDITIDVEDYFEELIETYDLDASTETLKKGTIKGVSKLLNNSGSAVKISMDYRELTKNSEAAKKGNTNLMESILGEGASKLFMMDSSKTVEEGDHPTLMRLPAQSVVPVHHAGEAEKHIGYFVLVDSSGNPVMDVDIKDVSSNCSDSLTKAGIQAMFDNSSNFVKQCGGAKSTVEASSSIFAIAMKRMMKNQLDDNGLTGLEVGHHHGIMNCIFRKAIKKQKVSLVYVPESLLSYYAFQYREDGTGKSLIEDIETLFAFRTTLIVAGLLAETNNSINKTHINVDLPEGTTNIEQHLKLISEIFEDKQMLRLDNNPMSVIKNLVSRGLTIAPKNVDGLGALEIDKSRSTNESSPPSTELMEMLTNFIITELIVPHASMNALGEDEYSRSVVTTNLFFSNEVRTMQEEVTTITTGLVKTYVQHSHQLMQKMYDIIKSDGAISDSKVDIDNIIAEVVSNIKTSLPTPLMASNKAQYEELDQQIKIIEDVLDKLFDDDLIQTDFDGADEIMPVARAIMRAKLIREAIVKLGMQNAIDVPVLEDFDMEEFSKVNQQAMNMAKMLRDMTDVHDTDN